MLPSPYNLPYSTSFPVTGNATVFFQTLVKAQPCIAYRERMFQVGFLLTEVPRIADGIDHTHFQFAPSQFIKNPFLFGFCICSFQITILWHITCKLLVSTEKALRLFRFVSVKILFGCSNVFLSFGCRRLISTSLVFNASVFVFEIFIPVTCCAFT